MAEKCACCGERDADETFPGITDRTRDLAGRPISTLCFVALLGEGKGSPAMAERIRARDSTLVQLPFKPENARVVVAGHELKGVPLSAVEREG